MNRTNEINGAVISGGSSLLSMVTGFIPSGDLEAALFVSALCTVSGFIITKVLNGIYTAAVAKMAPRIKAFIKGK